MGRGQAFVISVAAAATTMQASFNIMAGTGWLDLEPAPILAVEWLVAFGLIAFTSFLPALAVAALLDRVSSMRFFICVGAALIITVLLTVLGAAFLTQGDGDPDQLTFVQAVARYLCWTMPAAMAGSLCFWFCAFRNTGDRML